MIPPVLGSGGFRGRWRRRRLTTGSCICTANAKSVGDRDGLFARLWNTPHVIVAGRLGVDDVVVLGYGAAHDPEHVCAQLSVPSALVDAATHVVADPHAHTPRRRDSRHGASRGRCYSGGVEVRYETLTDPRRPAIERAENIDNIYDIVF